MELDREAFASIASPEFDAVSKFGSGRLEQHGPRAGMLTRCVNRFRKAVVDILDRSVLASDLDMGIMLSDQVRAAMMMTKGSPSNGRSFHMEFTSRPSDDFLGQSFRLLAASGRDGMAAIKTHYERRAVSMPLMGNAWKAMGMGTAGLLVASGIGAPTGMAIFGTMALAGAATGALSHLLQKTDARVALEIGEPVVVRHLPLGRYSAQSGDMTLPSQEFVELARATLTERLSDIPALAERQLRLIDGEFTARVMNNEPVSIESCGIHLNTLTGQYTILDKDNQLVATERRGELTVVNESIHERIMEAANQDQPSFRP